MTFPAFFDQVPTLVLRDPLAEILGAAEDGFIEYHYADAVKLAGHSCPTVAGAWLMARCALALLYPEQPPVRGAMSVELRAPVDVGTTGVVGAVLGLITGAAGEGGFKGLGGAQSRRDLLRFGVALDAEARITRLDSGVAVLLDYRPEAVPPDAAMVPLMARVVGGVADGEERVTFARLWQDRVRRILLEHADDTALISARVQA